MNSNDLKDLGLQAITSNFLVVSKRKLVTVYICLSRFVCCMLSPAAPTLVSRGHEVILFHESLRRHDYHVKAQPGQYVLYFAFGSYI
jgi:hypothetical protein